MKYIITGSLGNISKPIVKRLRAAGHEVVVISSNANKISEIEATGATAAIGSILDRDFLTRTFANADAAYLMIPPNWTVTDFYAYQKEVSDNYIHAIRSGSIKHVVLLSSIGANLRKGAGPIDGLGYLEEQLSQLKSVHVKMLRPSYFYTNLLSMIGLIKQAGIMGSNFGGAEEKIALVHTDDIAAVASQHLLDLNFKGQGFEYIVSDERYVADIADTISKAINKPNTPWVVFKDEDSLQGMLQAGLTQTLAEAYVQMGKAFREGSLQKDYYAHNLAPKGKIKLEDFVKEFTAIYTLS